MEVKPPLESRDMHSEIILQDDSSGSNTVEISEDLHQEENNVSRDVENKVEELMEKYPPPQTNESKKEVLPKSEYVSDQVDTKKKTVPSEKGEKEHSDFVVSSAEKDSIIPSVSKDGDGIASKSTSISDHIHIPKKVMKGGEEYNIVVTGIKDTGLSGSYWSASPEGRRKSINSQSSSYLPFDSSRPLPFCSKASENDDENGKAEVKSEALQNGTPSPKTPSAKVSRGRTSIKGIMRKRKAEAANSNNQEKKLSISLVDANKAGELIANAASSPTSAKAAASRESASTATSSTSAASTSSSDSKVTSTSGEGGKGKCIMELDVKGGKSREVIVECLAPCEDLQWFNVSGDKSVKQEPGAVQYARALRPPFHLQSFLQMKGRSAKGFSCTGRNTMVFVVMEGEVTVTIHTTEFVARKGDSFYIPPKNSYNLVNSSVGDCKLSIIQYQYEGSLSSHKSS